MGEWGGVINVLLLRPYTTFVLIVFLLRCTHFMLPWIRLLYFIAHTSCYVGYVFSTSLHTLHVTLDTSCLGGWGGGVGLLTSLVFVLHDPRSDRLFFFVAHTSCYVGYVFSTSLRTLHVTLDTSSLLRCTHFTLPWIRLLYFVAHTSCYVGYVFSTSLHTLHVTLDTSSLLPCAHFMLCWIHLLYFLAHTSCYLEYVFSTFLHILHVTLDTSSLLPCTYFM